ncbi:hypothetical protein HMPREF9622_02169 [Cutibacterium modestum HL037PA3]|nr:hypothetical protein HMPREF9622_02169 [Cutibacterium modestum HL037PA3]
MTAHPSSGLFGYPSCQHGNLPSHCDAEAHTRCTQARYPTHVQ